jgi:transposase
VKSDKVDARMLAELLAAGLIPREGDQRTGVLRRRVSRRRGLVKQATTVQNAASAVRVRNLKRRPALSDLFGTAGRAWRGRIELPQDEHETLDGCLRQLDFLQGELAGVDKAIAEAAPASDDIRRPLTIPGVDITTARAAAARLSKASATSGRIGLPSRTFGVLALTLA